MSYFYADESPHYGGKYLIRPNFNKLPLKHTTGSYNILMARLLNLSYPNFLRYCRDVHGAEITGKGSLYPVPYFTKGKGLDNLIKLLNENVKIVLNKGEKNYG